MRVLRLAAEGPCGWTKRLLAILERKPLSTAYRGSRRRIVGWRRRATPLTFGFHDNATVPSVLVRKLLVRDVGLADNEARKLL